MSKANNKWMQHIQDGDIVLGIELGSTRIKSVVIDSESHNVIASGSHDWENSLVDGYWTYGLEEIWSGLQKSYMSLKESVKKEYNVELKAFKAMGISAMMHGYMAFDEKDELLVPFRTWRNNRQEESAKALTEALGYPIPQRWSIAHLYQAILNQENHIDKIRFQTTLAGYLHWQLSGEKVIGVGEASGMFPIDLSTGKFNESMMSRFDELNESCNYPWKLAYIFPQVLSAGEEAGALSDVGAKLLDPTGDLEAGIPMCPPEGDAGTGMVATNSIAKRTGNVSAGTSVFAMIVLEKELSKVYEEIDQVTTPDGSLVAMVHSNNCSSNLDAWVGILEEAALTLGASFDKDTLYGNLYRKAMEGDPDCGGLLSIGYLSGEHITHFSEGRPLFARRPDSHFNLANFVRSHLYTALGALKIGIDILFKEEEVGVDEILGHGGFFKIDGVGNRVMAAASGVPVTLMETAGEGGAWGIAVLAAYLINKNGETLGDYLSKYVFDNQNRNTFEPIPEDVMGFEAFMETYKRGLHIERAAVDHL